jgi:hypothetical protein
VGKSIPILLSFLDHPFQNWTRDNPSLIGSVILYLDYTAPVDVIRAKAEEIAKGSKLWDKWLAL